MFEELLDIKKIREQGASIAVGQAKTAVKEAEQAVIDAEQAVADHAAFKASEEVRLFEEIRGQEVKLDDIDAMKFKIGLLKEKAEKLAAAVEDRKKAVETAQAAVETAEAAHKEAQRALQKFEEFVEIQREADKKAAAAKEEAEVEEVSETIFAARMRKVEG